MTDASRPQPVVNLVSEAAALSTRVSAAVKGLGAVLVLAGITTDSQVTQWAEAAGVVVVVLGELASYVYTRVQLAKAARTAAAQVTPLAAPQDQRGVELVPADLTKVEPGIGGVTVAMIAQAVRHLERDQRDDPGRHAAQEDTAGPP